MFKVQPHATMIAVHVHVLWPVCAHTIPFRMLWCPQRCSQNMKPLWKVIKHFHVRRQRAAFSSGKWSHSVCQLILDTHVWPACWLPVFDNSRSPGRRSHEGLGSFIEIHVGGKFKDFVMLSGVPFAQTLLRTIWGVCGIIQ